MGDGGCSDHRSVVYFGEVPLQRQGAAVEPLNTSQRAIHGELRPLQQKAEGGTSVVSFANDSFKRT